MALRHTPPFLPRLPPTVSIFARTDSHVFQSFIDLVAAGITIPIANRFGLDSVLGYLLAGILIGPHARGLVGQRGGDDTRCAEFGVVLMLFVVGFELQPAVLRRMRARGVSALATSKF